MRTKRLLVILIAVAFFCCAVFSCFFLFSVNKVNVEFKVSDDTDTLFLQNKFEDNLVGKNLLFLDLSSVNKILASETYFKVVSAAKQYPNVLKIKIEERKEVFYLEKGESVYLLDETGFVLKSQSKTEFDRYGERSLISLSFNNVEINSIKVGSVLSTDDDEHLNCVLAMARSIDLYDSVKAITVTNDAVDYRGAVFSMWTGGTISVWDVITDGILKIKTALIRFDAASDYVKSDCNVVVFVYNDALDGEGENSKFKNGEIVVQGLEAD